MALKYLIPFLSFFITVALAFALQSHNPSWLDFFGWASLLAIVTGGINLIAAIVLFAIRQKSLAKVFLYTAMSLVLLGILASVSLSDKWTPISK